MDQRSTGRRGKPSVKQKSAPRNYFTIGEAKHPDRSAGPVYHDCLGVEQGLTGAIELEVEALSPIHVGCGSYELLERRIVKEPVRRGGQLVIPGTSIKGMCRQIFEALTTSGSPFRRSEAHTRGGTGLSPAASVFGTLGLQGRVSFDDAVFEPATGEVIEAVRIELSVAYPPRKALGRRFYGRLPVGAAQPRTMPALAIPTGSRLKTTLRFRNVIGRSLGGVLTSLGVGLFTPRLGGGKYDDYGWVRFRPLAFRVRATGFGGGAWERRQDQVDALASKCQDQLTLDVEGAETLRTFIDKLQFPGRSSASRSKP